VAEVPSTRAADGAFTWVEFVDRDQRDVLAEVRRLSAHPAMFEDSLGRGRPPRLEVLDGQLLVIAWDLDPDKATSKPGDVVILTGDSWLLTAQWDGDGPARPLRPLIEREHPSGATPLGAAYRALAAVVQSYEATVASIENELDEVETEVFDPAVDEDYQRIYRLRRRIGHVDRAASALRQGFETNADALDDLLEDEPTLHAYFRHMRSDLVALADLLSTQRMALDAVVSSHESNVSSRQNRDMRTIAAVAALLALPTVVAGIYGMNFKDMPLLHIPVGWVFVLIGTVALDVAAVLVFRRRGWLGADHGRDR